MADNSTLKKSMNWFTAIGLCNEKASWIDKKKTTMQLEDWTIEKYEDGKPTGEKIKCQRLNGIVSLKTSDGIFDFNVNFTSKGWDGEDNERWKMALKILDWEPAIGYKNQEEKDEYKRSGKKLPDREGEMVTMSGSVSIYDSVSTKNGKVYANLNWDATAKCEHCNADFADTGCSLSAKAYVKSIRPEIRSENETGRLLVEVMAVGRKAAVFPINFIVEADNQEALDFFDDEDEIAVGDTLSFGLNHIKRHIGFGGKSKLKVKTNSGFDADELIYVEGDKIPEPEVTEDEDGNPIEIKTGWINPVAMKKAIKVRNQMLDEKIKNGKSTSTPTESFKDKKAKMQKTKSKPVDDEVDDDELDF